LFLSNSPGTVELGQHAIEGAFQATRVPEQSIKSRRVGYALPEHFHLPFFGFDRFPLLSVLLETANLGANYPQHKLQAFLLRAGIGLLEQFARDSRIGIRQPQHNMQKKIIRTLANGNEFVAYIDTIGHLDGKKRLLEWKTTSARYPDQPEGLTSLDLQLVCYSWISGISDVAIVAFVRKRIPELQYLVASITEEQRQEFGEVVETTVGQIETAQFPTRPGIRFPQNGCVSCAHLGLCLGNQPLIDSKLIRQPGASDLA
jgi:hypothetical protein